tara:strand:+ start:320 stop:502 length:183 start_codon:yes stop_codon:yes gene_type:complete
VAVVLATHLQAQLQVLEVMLLAGRVMQEVREGTWEAPATEVAAVVPEKLGVIMMPLPMFL